ncbi:MAG: NAD-dependent epimerase/dehydratase family protein [Pseudomonadota bacterium]
MKALVTGGGGFLGGAIVKQLLEKHWSVKTIQRGDYPHLREWGVETYRGDLVDKKHVLEATKDCDVVFHVAAKAGVWGSYQDYYRANVIATENILAACKELDIAYLVYTSTPSVVFDGHDEIGIDEDTNYPEQFFNAYQETKAKAEELVLTANTENLKTVALRPHLIWGPDDPHLVPRVIQRASAGKLKLVGNGQNKIDSCYIDNAALAHVLAAEELMKEAKCSGKAYFISNDEPLAIADLLNRILACANISPIDKSVPSDIAYAIGACLETAYKILRIKNEPIMTRFVAKQLSTAHWFDISAAKKDFAFYPKITIEQGMQRLKQSLKK